MILLNTYGLLLMFLFYCILIDILGAYLRLLYPLDYLKKSYISLMFLEIYLLNFTEPEAWLKV